MRRLLIHLTLFAMMCQLAPAADIPMFSPKSAPKSDLTTEQLLDKASYILGYTWSRNMASQIGEVNGESLHRGIDEGLAQKTPSMDEKEMRSTMMAFQQYMMEQKQNEAKVNLAKAEKWLDENKKKEGVVETTSGLQYKVIKEGNGDKPKATDKVTVHYHGTLLNGKVFDSSIERNKPASFALNRVIPGWTEGVQLMSPGAKYQFYLHPKLAYKERGVGSIPPNSMLTFDVELLSVEESKPKLTFPGQKQPKLVFPKGK